jgi:hypothetical protein
LKGTGIPLPNSCGFSAISSSSGSPPAAARLPPPPRRRTGVDGSWKRSNGVGDFRFRGGGLILTGLLEAAGLFRCNSLAGSGVAVWLSGCWPWPVLYALCALLDFLGRWQSVPDGPKPDPKPAS